MSESESIPTLAALQRSAHEYLKNSQWVAARQVLLQAAQHYAESADVFSDLAAAERALGQLDQAILHYQRSLELDPKLAFVHNNLGNALSEKGQLRDAIDCYHRALVLQPRYPEALNNLAKVLLREGRLDESRRALERLFAMTRDHLPAFETLAVLCERQGNVQEALQHYVSLASHYLKGADPERALWAMDACRRLGHRSAGLEANRCAAFLQLGRFEEARDAGIAALRLDPNHANAHVNLGSAYVSLGDYRSALTLQKRATELAPNLAEAFINLGNTLVECDDPQNALIAQNRALELDPSSPRAMCGLAVCYQSLGRRVEAADLYRRALTLAPNYAEAHFKYGKLLLSEGQLPEGFKEIEWRRSEPLFRKWAERYPGPMWSGQDVSGKTVVLYDEQSNADVLQFVRYAKAFKQRGARVVVDCRAPLHRLIAAQSYVDGVADTEEGGPVPFEAYAPIQSLPHIFGTSMSSIPSEHPYLQAPAPGPTQISLASGVKIGVAWGADPDQRSRSRSMGLDQLEPLFDIGGVSWFSLQVGAEREQLQRVPHPPVDLGASFSDFADTAAAISQLDLIITVDNAIAHLAGALGRPVWVLLPQHADWCWHLDREDSPWYPRARLFRQQQVSAWEPLIARMKQQLIQSVAAFARAAGNQPPAQPSQPPNAGQTPEPARPSAPPAAAMGTSEVPQARSNDMGGHSGPALSPYGTPPAGAGGPYGGPPAAASPYGPPPAYAPASSPPAYPPASSPPYAPAAAAPYAPASSAAYAPSGRSGSAPPEPHPGYAPDAARYAPAGAGTPGHSQPPPPSQAPPAASQPPPAPIPAAAPPPPAPISVPAPPITPSAVGSPYGRPPAGPGSSPEQPAPPAPSHPPPPPGLYGPPPGASSSAIPGQPAAASPKPPSVSTEPGSPSQTPGGNSGPE